MSQKSRQNRDKAATSSWHILTLSYDGLVEQIDPQQIDAVEMVNDYMGI